MEERSGARALLLLQAAAMVPCKEQRNREGTVREEQREEGRKEKAERDGSLLALVAGS